MGSRCVWRVLLALCALAGGRGGSGWEYQVHRERVKYGKALEGCSGTGGLAELPTQQEVALVLRSALEALGGSAGPQAFWVGLRKTEHSCVIPHLPLRGFRWLSDGGERSEGTVRWWSPPEPTCAADRCAALQVGHNGSDPAPWGLLARPCRNEFAFICRRTASSPGPSPAAEAETETLTPIAPTPAPTSTTAHSTPTPDTTTTSTHTPAPAAVATATTPGPEPGPGGGLRPSRGPGSRPCQMPSSPRFRWVQPGPEGGVLTAMCWSGARVRLHCAEGRWRPSGSAADLDAVCSGGQGTAPPPPPSPSGAGQEEARQEGVWAGLLVPVLAAVAVLVVLVGLVVGVVLCCRARRSKDRAVKKAEKMAMKNNEASGEKVRR